MSAQKSIQERAISPPGSRKRKRPISEPHGQSLKVYSWNVNGIGPFLQPSVASYFKAAGSSGDAGQSAGKASLRDFLRRRGWPTLLFVQEVKINPDDAATIRGMEKAVKRQPDEPDDAADYESHFCFPSDKHNARGFGRKVYGVCSIIRTDFRKRYIDRIRQVDWDTEGRFLVIETRANAGIPKLALINVYAVNGTDNPYKDPTSGEVIGTRHDRKLRVHELLQAEIRQLEADGFGGTIVAGDVNIARTPLDGHPNLRTFPKQHCINRADFEARFLADPSLQAQPPSASRPEQTSEEEPDGEDAPSNSTASKPASLGMVDTFRSLHPTQRSYTYYPRTKPFGESCDRVDLILISRSLQSNLKAAGMHETVQERGPSDHVPLYAELEFGLEQEEEEAGSNR
ncbi:uncharacterized protein LTR77_008224 [Saxophila tyrrhenica]|uniref:DNase I-like protein n=1 Tax=Saxophila tyrrhenica TaxID=1690608 RepID=A0AAV9P279_9PEZI|nr:hypothetical protein LTR77_008224 [Saxophila tyrrhenica]